MSEFTIESSNAFVSTTDITPYTTDGELSGLTFAVKDNIDLAGFKTSFGSKPWFKSHPPAVSHAVCVEQMLAAGARCVGKTVSDELTCSLDGESHFYGTPVNPKAPDCIPGGSSSGSASAVACGLVDFAIGTDSAGSIRVPASHCGVFGMRPSTHRVSASGDIPFAPSSSTVGMLASDMSTLEKTMLALLASEPVDQKVKRIYLLQDAFRIADSDVTSALDEPLHQLKNLKNVTVESIEFSDIVGMDVDLEFCWRDIFNVIQCIEIWNAVGAWVKKKKPEMGYRVHSAMGEFAQRDRTGINEALKLAEKVCKKINGFIKEGELFCMPTVPMVAPLKGALDDMEVCKDYYIRTMSLTSFAGVGRLPQITVPVADVEGKPLGLSFIAGYRQDELLLSCVKNIYQ